MAKIAGKFSLKSILEEEDKKVDEVDDEKVDESDDEDQVDENDAWADKVNGERTSASRAGDKVYKEAKRGKKESDEEEVDEDDDEVTESDEEEVDEDDDEEVTESDEVDEDEDEVMESKKRRKKESFSATLPKPGALRKEAEGEPKEANSKLDGEGKPGETKAAPKLDGEGKPGQTNQAGVTESDEEEQKDEDEKEKIEEEDDEDLLLIEDEEDTKTESKKRRSKKESEEEPKTESKKRRKKESEEEVDEDDDEVTESDDEEVTEEDEVKVDEAVLDRMLKALKVEAADLATFKDILRGAMVESVRGTATKAVKRAKKAIYAEANSKIRESISRKKIAIKKLNAIQERAYVRFEESHKKELRKLAQYDEMVSLFKSMTGVMESYGLSIAPANKKLKIQLEQARVSHAKEAAALRKENAQLKTEAERAKIRTSVERMTKTMTESEKAEFMSIVAEMKVEDNADFIRRATKVKDRLYKEDTSYDQFVERFTESAVIENRRVVEDKTPRNVMEASLEVLRTR